MPPEDTIRFTRVTDSSLYNYPENYLAHKLLGFEDIDGLKEYDYGARRRETGIPVWTTMDTLCEKYYAISPYTYCSDDPAKNIDPDGLTDYYV
jgi:RHS repeat-associated protein